jgi:hypothetical protein
MRLPPTRYFWPITPLGEASQNPLKVTMKRLCSRSSKRMHRLLVSSLSPRARGCPVLSSLSFGFLCARALSSTHLSVCSRSLSGSALPAARRTRLSLSAPSTHCRCLIATGLRRIFCSREETVVSDKAHLREFRQLRNVGIEGFLGELGLHVDRLADGFFGELRPLG